MAAPDAIAALLDARLLLVTGKGGTGKTTYASAFALLAAARKKRVLLCEVDMQRPATPAIFGEVPDFEPREVLPGLSVTNVAFRPALESFLRRVVPAGRIIRRVLDNRLVQRFLDVTPGSRELTTLARIAELVDRYDLVVVDMPASGHAFSLLDVLRSALSLFRSGPVRRVAAEVRARLVALDTRVAFIALPEEMVVNETLETVARMRSAGVLGGPPVALLNRATLPSLSEPEQSLISRLAATPLAPEQREFVLAGLWESELEQATALAQDRLTAGFGAQPILVPPGPPGGVPRHVVHGVAVQLGRQIGLSKRDLPWV